MKTENSDLMRAAKISLKGKWGLVIGAMLVFFIINIVISYLPKVGLISGYIIGGPFALGWAGFILSVSRDQSAKLSQIFQGFNNFGTAFLAYFLSALFMVLWSLLLIVPGIIAGFSYSLTFYVLADDNSIRARDAIAKSKKMMYGYKWQAFRLVLRFLALSLLGILTLGIGFIWLLPYMYVGWAKFYEHVKSNFAEVESVDTQHQGAAK
jgi:uncharacterized membrane protein